MSIAKALVLVTHGTEAIETVTTVDLLRRAGLNVTLGAMGLKGRDVVELTSGVQLTPDQILDQSHPNPNASPRGHAPTAEMDRFDAIIMPGGLKGAQAFCANRTATSLLKSYYDQGKLVAAICAAPTIIKAAGIGGPLCLTSYPSLKSEFDGLYKYCDDKAVVVDGNLITSRGPHTAFQFALAIIKYLASEEIADNVASQVLFNTYQ
ncbi:hypothetical protein BJ085DRAFT_13903 [Dimargaris cristalligena]|uniref:D-lactate dehydratase n=1 Tax=Dimargaris cristalligena TaxID=215637 RepID=A0A4P9ZZW3_9FUNG|nr:hypothetical protein BJ085DRAFT_13903 [Dimargaris cristalligena]|eukprot:RKP38988.1 hypothetical protein BJ085DRAFT_13903 [Dimargaris cristalligena]